MKFCSLKHLKTHQYLFHRWQDNKYLAGICVLLEQIKVPDKSLYLSKICYLRHKAWLQQHNTETHSKVFESVSIELLNTDIEEAIMERD